MDGSLLMTNEPDLFEPFQGDMNIMYFNEILTSAPQNEDDDMEIVEEIVEEESPALDQLFDELLEQDDPDDLTDNTGVNGTDEITGVNGTDEITGINGTDHILTNEVFLDGVEQIINAIDGDSINEEVIYNDFGSVYSANNDLPDFSVIYQCDGVDVIFPTSYSEDLIVQDGMLINLGANYTAGATIDGANVNNYLSSEITIPTYHSSTWYQYMQTYGMPYRIVDRYVNNMGNISSTTRSSVDITWSGGNPWQGFTFDRAAMFIIIVILAVMLVFRKGSKV